MADPSYAPDTDAEPALNVVELFVEGEGLALLIYGPAPCFCVHDVAFIPLAELDPDEVDKLSGR
jgi:hypothetical protein